MNMEVRSESNSVASTSAMDVDANSADDQMVPIMNENVPANDNDSGNEDNQGEELDDTEAERPEVPLTREQKLIFNLRNQIPDVDRLFTIHRRIGEGTFSSVFLASVAWHRNRPMNKRRVYAIKHLIPTTHPRRVAQELICLKEMGSANNNVSGVELCLRKGDEIAFVMPFISHIRFVDYFDKMGTLELQDYMRNLLIALKHVHSFKVIHRDVKPSNFLYDRRNKKYLLVDFGLAQILDKDKLCASYKALAFPETSNTNNAENGEDEESTACDKDEQDNKIIDLGDSVSNIGARMKTNNGNEFKMKRRTPHGNDIENQCSAGVVNPAKRHCGPAGRQMSANPQNEAAPMEQQEPRAPTSNIPSQPFKTPLQQINEISNKQNARPVELNSTLSADVKSAVLSVSMNKKIEHLRNNNNGGSRPSTPNQVAGNSTGNNNKNRNNDPIPTTSGHKYNLDNRLNGKNAKCLCYARESVCNMCLIKPEINASRAGTPGYRPTEVLVKYPNQTTAVDMWATGVILVSILSGCYPFFQGSNDFVALCELIAVFGLDTIKTVAYDLGRHVVCNMQVKPSHLRKLCIRFRHREQFKVLEQLELEEEQKRQRQNTLNDDNNTSSTKQTAICDNCDQKLLHCLCADTMYNTDFSNDCYPDSVYDLLAKLLAVHPKDRLSAAEALEHPFFKEEFQ